MCREKTRKAKAQLELSLATKVKGNNKYFCKYIYSKRRARENLHPFYFWRAWEPRKAGNTFRK